MVDSCCLRESRDLVLKSSANSGLPSSSHRQDPSTLVLLVEWSSKSDVISVSLWSSVTTFVRLLASSNQHSELHGLKTPVDGTWKRCPESLEVPSCESEVHLLQD